MLIVYVNPPVSSPARASRLRSEVANHAWLDGAFRDMSTMKSTLKFLLTTLALAAVVGCSTPGSKPTFTDTPLPAATAVTDAKLFYEMGKLDLAKQKLLGVLQLDPDNPAARYYLDLVREAEFHNTLNQRNPGSRFWYPAVPPRPVGSSLPNQLGGG